MINKRSYVIVVFALFCGCATYEVNRSYYDSAIERINEGKYQAAYRLLEDPTPGREVATELLMRENTNLLPAGLETFSPLALTASIKKYGQGESFVIERRRLERFGLYADNEKYRQALANVKNVFPVEYEKEKNLKFPDSNIRHVVEVDPVNKNNANDRAFLLLDDARKNKSSEKLWQILREYPNSKYAKEVAELLYEYTPKDESLVGFLVRLKGYSTLVSVRPIYLSVLRDVASKMKLLSETMNCDAANVLRAQLEKVGESAIFDYEECKSRKLVGDLLKSDNPVEMYFAGVKYEDASNRPYAKKIYRAIIDRFSSNQIAMKAADRLARIKDVEAVEESNVEAAVINALSARAIAKAQEDAEDRARSRQREAEYREEKIAKEQRYQQSQVCKSVRQTCINSCPNDRKGRADYSCTSRCGYCN